MTPLEKRVFDRVNMLAARIFDDPSHPLIGPFRIVMTEELASSLAEIERLSTPKEEPWTPPKAEAPSTPATVTPGVTPPEPPPATVPAPPVVIEVPVAKVAKVDKPLLDAWGKPKEVLPAKPLEPAADKP